MNEENTNQLNLEMTAGEMLRNARTTGRRKREIPTIAKLLCIREEFLQALEDGNYNVIPEVVYILGFARNYAMELGLNPDEVVEKIKKEMGLVEEPDDATEQTQNVEKALLTGKKISLMTIFSRCYQFLYQHWIWFFSGLVALMVIIAVSIVMTSGGKKDSTDNAAQTETQIVAPTVVEPVYNVDVRERFGTENRETANVILQAIQESWVKIEDGRGNTVFSRVLVPGDVYYVPAGDRYKGTFGNAGGVDVWVNGKQAPAVGADHTRANGVSLAPGSLMKKGA